MLESEFNSIRTKLHEELGNLRTGRANPALIEGVQVEAYGSVMKLQELASINAPEPQTLVVQPWDKSVVKAIESALQQSELDLNPVVDGELLRISFPPLTEERRAEMVKLMHEKIEDARVAARKVREDHLKELKAQQKDGSLSEDEYFRMEKEIQQEMDKFNNEAKEIAESKEQELMTV